ncbi:hypothetical protein KBB27_02965, partial [Patescibacteria group bacterium]|nr:hypothetical protein [Patescibacteria group bacterium]
MENYRLEKPSISKNDRLAILQALEEPTGRQQLGAFIKQANEPDYRYWDTAKHKRPLPFGLNPLQAWFAVKLQRLLERQPSPIHTEDGHTFGWIKLGIFERYCHEFDLHTGGELLTSVGELRADEKKRLISKGLMDEAIASAQLEGADTGRAYAKKMLREKIKPRNSSDQMILNNHRAMLAIESQFKNQPLSLDLLMEMHSILTEKTYDSEGNTPKLRTDDEPMYVLDIVDGVIYHKAPSVT